MKKKSLEQKRGNSCKKTHKKNYGLKKTVEHKRYML